MSTPDVPGHKKANNDELGMGCWAEHDDGSLILVESAEGGQVIFSMFDTSQHEVFEYRDRMNQGAFNKAFSWDSKDPSSDRWTWHDKTPFPWDRVMAERPAGARPASADQTMNTAERLAKARGLDPKEFDYDSALVKAGALGQSIVEKVQRALSELIK